MKIEKIDGKIYITLEHNHETVNIGILNNNEVISITKNGVQLDISGSSNIVNSINGDGMLKKVYLPPDMSSKEIIEKCDIWLDLFKKIYDKFAELVVTDKYKDQRIYVDLSFNEFKFIDTGKSCKTINLDLKQFGTLIQEGVSISLDAKNEDVYAYLVANVLDYFIKNNFNGNEIKYLSSDYTRCLYSIRPRGKMVANLTILYDNSRLKEIITSILCLHNLGISGDQIIDNLRNIISHQPIEDKLDSGIAYTEQQYKHIFKDELEKKLKRNN